MFENYYFFSEFSDANKKAINFFIEKSSTEDQDIIKMTIDQLVKLRVDFNVFELLFLYYHVDVHNLSEQSSSMLISINEINQVENNIPVDDPNLALYQEVYISLSINIDVILFKSIIILIELKSNKNSQNEQIKLIANYAKNVYAPLMHRLGIYGVKAELEDLSLYILDKKEFLSIAAQVELKKEERIEIINKMIIEINLLLKDKIIGYQVKGRSKSIYSIYNKMKLKDKSFEDLYDLQALRILCNTKEECYDVLAELHNEYYPIISVFKDYIAKPKANLYQSLHTSILNKHDQIFEIQIRTYQMNEIADFGVAAHVNYKEGKQNKNKADNYLDIIKSGKVNKINFIYVYTPDKKIFSLPKESTVIDFAFKIHTDVGVKMIGARVNGQAVSYKHQLSSLDVVEILTKKNAPGPNESWLKIVKSNHARRKIIHYLNQQSQEKQVDIINRGTSILSRELVKNQIDIHILDDTIRMNYLFNKYSAGNIENFYLQLLSKKIKIDDVIKSIQTINAHNPNQIKYINAQVKDNTSNIIIEGSDGIKLEIAKCCLPILGDPIIAKVQTGVALKIHRSNCNNIQNSTQLLAAKWNLNYQKVIKYESKIIIIAINQKDLLAEIIQLLTVLKVGLVKLTQKESINQVKLILIVSILDLEHLERLKLNLMKNPKISQIKRI